MSILSSLSKLIGDKARWRQYRARKARLPANYRAVLEAVQRYTFMHGPGTGDASMSLLEDLADVLELAAASGTPIHDVVGDDPVEFAEGFIRNYEDAAWITTERTRLTRAVEDAMRDDTDENGQSR